MEIDLLAELGWWKRIPFLAERFEASRDGLIRTRSYETTYVQKNGKKITRHFDGRILKPRMASLSPKAEQKKPIVTIYMGEGRANRRNRRYSVARLVACTHLGIPFDMHDQSQIQSWRLRYLDGDVMNCSADNLEWVYNAGENGSGGANQRRYEQNLDAYRSTDPVDVMARLFAEAA